MDSQTEERDGEPTPLVLLTEYRANEVRERVFREGIARINRRQEEIKEELRPLFEPGKTRTFYLGLGVGEPLPVICTAYVAENNGWFSLSFNVPENPATLEWPMVEAEVGENIKRPFTPELLDRLEEETAVTLYKRDLRDLDEAS